MRFSSSYDSHRQNMPIMEVAAPKGLGYLISTLSVGLLAVVSWSNARKDADGVSADVQLVEIMPPDHNLTLPSIARRQPCRLPGKEGGIVPPSFRQCCPPLRPASDALSESFLKLPLPPRSPPPC